MHYENLNLIAGVWKQSVDDVEQLFSKTLDGQEGIQLWGKAPFHYLKLEMEGSAKDTT